MRYVLIPTPISLAATDAKGTPLPPMPFPQFVRELVASPLVTADGKSVDVFMAAVGKFYAGQAERPSGYCAELTDEEHELVTRIAREFPYPPQFKFELLPFVSALLNASRTAPHVLRPAFEDPSPADRLGVDRYTAS